MSIFDAVRVAVRAIIANGLRSLLTTLGMVIGVGSVIVLIAVGQGSQKGVEDQIRSLGSDLIFVQPAAQAQTGGVRGQGGGGGGGISLRLTDAALLTESGVTGISAVAPQLTVPVQVVSATSNEQVTMVGTTPSYEPVRAATVAQGRFITEEDGISRALNAVLGATIADTLFPAGDAVGQTIRVTTGGNRINLTFRVVGVLALRGGSGGGQQDSYVIAPLETVSGRISVQRNVTGAIVVNQLNIQTTPNADQDVVKAQVTGLLLNEHAVTSPDFLLQSQDDLLGATDEVSRTLSLLLGSIAGISLVVGGIGVMNIMLVSVTERTREIGIRRAVGARRRDIVLQFLTEALTLCIGGGVLGILVGVGVALGIDGRTVSDQELATVIQPWSVVVAFVVAAGIGIVAGSYPAVRAAQADPIEALRSE